MKRVFWGMGVVWTGIVLGLFVQDIDAMRKVTAEMARKEALSHFNKDQASRLWAASHGGVYVPVTEKLAPNPYLAHVPARDIIGRDGTVLTLMNPAYMIREMMNHYSKLYGIRGHITSLKHLRSETAPDPWERSALLAFERGVGEVCETSEIEREPYLRLMRPMFTEQSCLKCHLEQGYKEGDIQGGVSVSVPLATYLASQRQEMLEYGISFSVLWILGLAVIAFLGKKTMRYMGQQLETEGKYTTVVESSLTGIYIVQDGTIAFANDRFAEIHGYSTEEVVGMDSLELVHPADRAFIREMRNQRMTGENAPSEYEARGVKKNGEVISVQRRNTVIDYGGKPAILGNVLDVTALKKAESDSKTYAEELERSNKELQDFAFIASHDLQEPLRKIRSFGDLLKSKCADSLDEQAQDFINRMQNAGGRMYELIQGLLAYSRVSTKASPHSQVDLNQALREALSNLEVRVKDVDAAIDAEALPTVDADPLQMTQLLQNLIGNAIKFQGDKERPQVKIYSRLCGDHVELSVEDNGVGFEEEHLERIFAPFERLHGRSEYEGVGMGLAICRKIVERHGGTITAKSTLGKGSTFIVKLPRKQSR
jgi:two-component system, chemotaxis family, sensor kinase Cph1